MKKQLLLSLIGAAAFTAHASVPLEQMTKDQLVTNILKMKHASEEFQKIEGYFDRGGSNITQKVTASIFKRFPELQKEKYASQIEHENQQLKETIKKENNLEWMGQTIKQIYEKSFTKQELIELTNFYQTSLGQKMLKTDYEQVSPAIRQQSRRMLNQYKKTIKTYMRDIDKIVFKATHTH